MPELRVGVIGLYSNKNIGDYLLGECASLLLEKKYKNVTIKQIDADPHFNETYRGLKKINLHVFKWFNRHRKDRIFQSPRIRYAYGYYMWWLKNNWYYKEQIKDLDCIIIAGGGFIKFKTQGLNYIDMLIIKIAEQRGIPVMFNAVGVEGYDEDDLRCQKLKKAINSDIVKAITTRDDLDTLRNHYITNKNILTDRVGDTVFWLKECYNVQQKPKAKAIGINLINPDNYISYGGTSDYATIEKFYKDLITELQKKKAEFYLFSNGMKPDHRFGKSLVKQMKLPKETLTKRPVTSPEFLEQMSNFGVILAARMHAGIVAYAMGIPKVGLIWSEKIDFFSTLTGERKTYFNEHEMDPKKIAALLCDVGKLPTDTAKARKLKRNTLTYLDKFLNVVGKPKKR